MTRAIRFTCLVACFALLFALLWLLIFPTKGDVNLDGKVTLTDMLMIKKHVLGIERLKALHWMAADIDCNCRVDERDLELIKQMLLQS